ncbi:hypothetical protein F8M41_016494 [Gigaspora margarita]|uniref:Uncharacterized protein n=1 Tax=Gigaspora margarita TaxID=4874 RepID=A0A8H4EMK4_GIGMA|nr:hypothetical protein F8M41_016494 [Gigaspora margarita]
MSSHGYNPSNVHEATLPEDSNHTINLLLSEITTYFVDRGFQESLVRSFLEGEVHLDLRTNAELMFDFLEERQRLDPTIFVGIEGSGVSGIASGEDKRLLVKWGLTEEAASELRILSFEDIFYEKQFPRNQWISYDRKGGPQMFASSYEDIATGIDDFLSSNTKVADANTMCSTYRLSFAQRINKAPKNRRGFTGIVVYWVNMDSLKNMKYQDLVSEGEDLWKNVVVASRCEQRSAVDDNDFVYGYQLSNPREVLSEWRIMVEMMLRVRGRMSFLMPDGLNPFAIFSLLLTRGAVDLMDSYCVGVIYFSIQNRESISSIKWIVVTNELSFALLINNG